MWWTSRLRVLLLCTCVCLLMGQPTPTTTGTTKPTATPTVSASTTPTTVSPTFQTTSTPTTKPPTVFPTIVPTLKPTFSTNSTVDPNQDLFECVRIETLVRGNGGILTFGALISMVCYAIIFYAYFTKAIPALHKHPTEISIHKCVYELIYVFQYLWLAYPPNTFFWRNPYAESEEDCTANGWQVGIFAFICQFSLLGGELWYCVLSRDVHITITNPFASYETMEYKYFIIVFVISFATGAILLYSGPKVYGLSSDPAIWIQDNHPVIQNFLFNIWLYLIYIYSFWVVWYARRQIQKGLQSSAKARMVFVNRATSYTMGYSIFWTLVFVIELVDIKEDSTLSAFFLASRGIWSLGVIVAANWSELSRSNKKFGNESTNKVQIMEGGDNKFDLNRWTTFSSDRMKSTSSNMSKSSTTSTSEMKFTYPHLSKVLRSEILDYTTQGIRIAVLEAINESNGGRRQLSNETNANRSSFGRNVRMLSGYGKAEQETVIFSFYEVSQLADRMKLPSMADDHGNPMSSSKNPLHLLGAGISSQRSASAELNRPSDYSDRDSARLDSVNIHDRSPSTAPMSPSGDTSWDMEKGISGVERENWVRATTGTQAGAILSKAASLKTRDMSFCDFAPKMFSKIRAISNIQDVEYLEAFSEAVHEAYTAEHSGRFLYYTSDHKFIVKTSTQQEVATLVRILPDYVDHLDMYKYSLIDRFLGAHSIVMYGVIMYFIVVLNFIPDSSIAEKYELNGSWVDRNRVNNSHTKTSSDSKLSSGYEMKMRPLYKDNDLQHRVNLRIEEAVDVSLQIKADIKFLRGLNLMGYNMLMGVRRRKFEIVDSRTEQADSLDGTNPFHQDADGAMHAGAVEGPGTYFFGISHILREWTLSEKLLQFVQVHLWFLDEDGIECMAPKPYASRFWNRAVRDVFEYVEEILSGDLDAPINDTPENLIEAFINAVAEEEDCFTADDGGINGEIAKSTSHQNFARLSSMRESAMFHDRSSEVPGSTNGRGTLSASRRSIAQVQHFRESHVMRQKGADERFAVVMLDIEATGGQNRSGNLTRRSLSLDPRKPQ